MSQEQVTQLTNELTEKNNLILQNTQQMKCVKAELEASKQMCNEVLQSGHALRTNMIIFQNALQEANQEIANVKNEKTSLAAENESLLARITALDAEVSRLKAFEPSAESKAA